MRDMKDTTDQNRIRRSEKAMDTLEILNKRSKSLHSIAASTNVLTIDLDPDTDLDSSDPLLDSSLEITTNGELEFLSSTKASFTSSGYSDGGNATDKSVETASLTESDKHKCKII